MRALLAVTISLVPAVPSLRAIAMPIPISLPTPLTRATGFCPVAFGMVSPEVVGDCRVSYIHPDQSPNAAHLPPPYGASLESSKLRKPKRDLRKQDQERDQHK